MNRRLSGPWAAQLLAVLLASLLSLPQAQEEKLVQIQDGEGFLREVQLWAEAVPDKKTSYLQLEPGLISLRNVSFAPGNKSIDSGALYIKGSGKGRTVLDLAMLRPGAPLS